MNSPSAFIDSSDIQNTSTLIKPALDDALEAMKDINMFGLRIPPQWFDHLKYDSGRSHTNAALILSEIVSWWIPTIERSEVTGRVRKLKKKFSSDLLQRSRRAFSSLTGLSINQVDAALKYLRKKGLIYTEIRKVVKNDGAIFPNSLFIGVYPEAIKQITEIQKPDDSPYFVELPDPEPLEQVSPPAQKPLEHPSETQVVPESPPLNPDPGLTLFQAELFNKFWTRYYDFCMDVGESPGQQADAREAFDREISPENAGDFWEGFEFFEVAKRAIHNGNSGKALQIPHAHRFITNKLYVQSLDYKRRKEGQTQSTFQQQTQQKFEQRKAEAIAHENVPKPKPKEQPLGILDMSEIISKIAAYCHVLKTTQHDFLAKHHEGLGMPSDFARLTDAELGELLEHLRTLAGGK